MFFINFIAINLFFHILEWLEEYMSLQSLLSFFDLDLRKKLAFLLSEKDSVLSSRIFFNYSHLCLICIHLNYQVRKKILIGLRLKNNSIF